MINGEWRKSRRSGSNNACVEVRLHDGAVEVRDSKAGDAGSVLRFSEEEYLAFLDGLKAGLYDRA